MVILAVNGSPRGRDSITDLMLQPFLAGTEKAGAHADTLYLTESRVEHCRGCFACWYVTPGKCPLRDDMDSILDRVSAADVIVFGSPVYTLGMTSLMKAFIDRLMPICTDKLQPDPEIMARYFLRQKPRHGILMSNCGDASVSTFNLIVENFRFVMSRDLDAAILRPEGSRLRVEGETTKSVLDALWRAGEAYALTARVPDELLRVISAPIVSAS